MSCATEIENHESWQIFQHTEEPSTQSPKLIFFSFFWSYERDSHECNYPWKNSYIELTCISVNSKVFFYWEEDPLVISWLYVNGIIHFSVWTVARDKKQWIETVNNEALAAAANNTHLLAIRN